MYRSDDDDVDEDDDDDKLGINTSDSCLDCWLRDGGGGDGVVDGDEDAFVLLEFRLVASDMFSWGVASVEVSCLRLEVRFRTISSSFRNVHVCVKKK